MIFQLAVGFIVTSCVVYHPQTSDIPLINEKNDLRIDAGISLIPSAYATISYGLTQKIAVQTFGSIGSDEKYYFQGAVGYFKDLGRQKVMEIYGGFGYGYGEVTDNVHPGFLFGNYQLYFTQFNFGKVECAFANFDFGFALKAGYLYTDLTEKNYYDYYPIDEISNEYFDSNLLLEPTIIGRIGGKKLKFNLKLGSCWIYKFTDRTNHFPYSYINVGLGLNCKF
ncbi:MAG: hypothetical protein EHM34_09540 [Nitrosopumilales archaeon]|nr:MAG: hypothetical protein EHM34_09540 [Nitrosopumilales archaeon]